MSEALRLHAALRATFRLLFAQTPGARFEERRGYDLLVSPTLCFPQFNGVWPLDDGAAASLSGAVAEVERLGLPCWVQSRRGRTTAVAGMAEQLGLTCAATVPGMYLRGEDLRRPDRPRVHIAEAMDPPALQVAAALFDAGFEVPAGTGAPLYTPAIATASGMRIYVATDGGVPVSTAIGCVAEGGVGVFNVATPPEHRRRGYGTAITAYAAASGLAAGARFVWLQSSPMARSLYEALGFYPVEIYDLFARAG